MNFIGKQVFEPESLTSHMVVRRTKWEEKYECQGLASIFTLKLLQACKAILQVALGWGDIKIFN